MDTLWDAISNRTRHLDEPMNPLSITLAELPALLYAERAIYFPTLGTLMITDTHFGKTASFRAGLTSLSDGDIAQDIRRLDRLIAAAKPEQLIMLGDLVHGGNGYDRQVLSQVSVWADSHLDLPVTLVRGNHDWAVGDPPDGWGIECVNAPYVFPPFVLNHFPKPDPRGYVLAGHLHPAGLLLGQGRQRLKLPCFWVGERVGVLPAFGGSVSHVVIHPARQDQTYVVTDDDVIQV